MPPFFFMGQEPETIEPQRAPGARRRPQRENAASGAPLLFGGLLECPREYYLLISDRNFRLFRAFHGKEPSDCTMSEHRRMDSTVLSMVA